MYFVRVIYMYTEYNLKMYSLIDVSELFHLTFWRTESPKQVLRQTAKTQMKWQIMQPRLNMTEKMLTGI